MFATHGLSPIECERNKNPSEICKHLEVLANNWKDLFFVCAKM